MSFEITSLLKLMMDKGASDLHLTVGSPPALRVNGLIVRVKSDALTPESIKKLCYQVLSPEQISRFEKDKEIDFSFGFQGLARCRANMFFQRGALAAVFRRINNDIPTLENLGFSQQVIDVAKKPHGLILVTGATGSGKSTTIASYLDRINKENRYHIVTIEDPIEFTHSHQMSIVNQREVGTDCIGFAKALRQVLREDPDVIMVGEMRDRETAEATLHAAETGHLVFSTLHTNGAVTSINRLIQLFPTDLQDYVRTQLSFCLEGVLSQVLLTSPDKKRRFMVYEYLAMTPATRNLIRENKLHQIYGQMQMGQDGHGMRTLNQNLVAAVIQGLAEYGEAASNSPDIEEFEKLYQRALAQKGRAA